MEGDGACTVRPAGVDLRMFLETGATSYKVYVDRLIGNGSGPYANFPSSLGAPREPESEISDLHKNIAHAVQEMCEQAMFSVVRMALEKTGSKNLCLAGGVALNSKANGKIVASGLIEKLFVQPAASDDGVALGAALAPFLDSGARLPLRAMRHAYLGPSFDDDAIETALKTYKSAPRASPIRPQRPPKCYRRGKSSAGTRADGIRTARTGSRSILADPRDPK